MQKKNQSSKHTHAWRVSYTSKDGETYSTRYFCPSCVKFKTVKGKPSVKRLSNMGGEFSTNWRP